MNGTVVVTGASRGVGRAVAEAFAAEGAHVVLAARDADALDAVVAEIEADGGTATAHRADVRDEFDVERLMETAARVAGDGIDAVVACAAVNHGAPGEMAIQEESYTHFDDTVRTNVRGVFATLREAHPHLADDARVLVPSGRVADDPGTGMGAYAVSKAGAEAVARGFAADTDATVGVLRIGRVATDLSGGEGRDPEAIAEMFVWAVRECDADELDGGVVDVKTWVAATR